MHSKLHVTYISINDAVEYSSNARTHDRSQIQQIARSIQEFGFLVPVLLDENNVVIAGHGRILAAWELGLEAIPAIQANHLIPNQTRAYRNADNKLTENAGWDEGLLRVVLEFLTNANIDFYTDLTDFSTLEIDLFLSSIAAPED